MRISSTTSDLTERRQQPKAEFARWGKSHPACRSAAFNTDPELHDFMGKRGIRLAGLDELAHRFEAGTPKSETHLVWILFSGRMACDTGEGYRVMKPGDVAFCPAMRPHWFRLASRKASGLWLHFPDDRRWARLAAVASGIHSGLPVGALRGLAEFYLSDSPFRDPAAIGAKIHALELILFSVEQAIDRVTGTKRHTFRIKVQSLERRIQAGLDTDWTVSAMAGEMGMSPSCLHKATLLHLGIRPMGLVTKLRMDHAISRLIHTNMTLAAIAEETGYSSPFAFSAAFKREVGRSPKAFRAALGGGEL